MIELIKRFSPWSYAVIGVILLIGLIILNPFHETDSGHRTHVQTIGGNEWVRFNPGFYWVGFFSKTTDYTDVVTIQYEEEKDRSEDITFFGELITGQFNDATTAKIGFTVKWELPDIGDQMIQIHKDYRSQGRLGQSLAGYSRECMSYSTQLMDSESHYSGGKSRLKDIFQYQLRNGQYILEQKEVIIREPNTNEVIKRTYEVNPKVNKDSSFVLSKSDIQNYKIKPNYVAITHVDYDEQVDKKLTAKIEQSTNESISKQALMTAQQVALTAEAQGAQLIAETRAREEASKIEAVIQAEKATAISQEQAKQAVFVAQKIKAEKDAEAAANRALNAAGLTPQEKAEWEYKTRVGVAAEIAKLKFPEMMILGGGENGALNPFDAIGLESFINLQKKMSDNK